MRSSQRSHRRALDRHRPLQPLLLARHNHLRAPILQAPRAAYWHARRTPERLWYRRHRLQARLPRGRLWSRDRWEFVQRASFVAVSRSFRTNVSLSQKYPKFPERIGEGLVDIFGEKGKYVVAPCSLSLNSKLSSSRSQGHPNLPRRGWIRSWCRRHRRFVPSPAPPPPRELTFCAHPQR